MQSGIIVTTKFEAYHSYPKAPDAVSFLRDTHRHEFYVRVEAEVFHDDREIEFIILKRALNQYLASLTKSSLDLGTTSCEMLCRKIQEFVKTKFPASIERDRFVNVEVWEDGENGAFVREF